MPHKKQQVVKTTTADLDDLILIDRLDVLPQYDAQKQGLLATERDHSTLYEVSGPGLQHLSIAGVVQIRNTGERLPVIKDSTYHGFCRFALPPSDEFAGRFSAPAKAHEALEKWLEAENG